VYTLVEAPQAGWFSARTLGSLVGVAGLLPAVVPLARSTPPTRRSLRLPRAVVLAEAGPPPPLVRLGLLRSSSLVRANLGAMSLFGGWVGFQFVVTLYLQQLRGWSALDTGLAIFPAGMLVAVVSPRMASLIGRFGVSRLIVAGMISITAGY